MYICIGAYISVIPFLKCPVSASRTMADLSLSDALTDSAPPAAEENMVARDFVSALEAEPFDDQVGETVGKIDYIPLLDRKSVG